MGHEAGPCERNGARAQVRPDSVCGTNESGLGRCPGPVSAPGCLLPSTTGQQSAQSRSPGVPVARTPLRAALDTRWSLAEEGSAEGSSPPTSLPPLSWPPRQP